MVDNVVLITLIFSVPITVFVMGFFMDKAYQLVDKNREISVKNDVKKESVISEEIPVKVTENAQGNRVFEAVTDDENVKTILDEWLNGPKETR